MAQQIIGDMDYALDGAGDPAKWDKVNEMFQELYGLTAEGWTDLRFPVQGINPAGTTAPPAIDDVLTSFPGTLLFSGTLENVIAFVAQTPHEMIHEDGMRPHIHWSKPVGSANAVSWVLYYRHLGNPGDVAGAWVGPLSPLGTIGDPGTTDEHCLTYWDFIDMSDKKGSAMLNVQLRRLGNSDADSGTARLFEVDFHVHMQGNGSVPEVPV